MKEQSDLSPKDLRAKRRLEIVPRQIAHFENGTTESHPDGPRFIPVYEHTSNDLVASERDLMRTVPLVAAHSSQLSEEDAFRCEVLLDVPILLVRQSDGAVKAFLNSCSHRGAQLLEGEGKIKNRIRCPYHSWSYSSEGELMSVSQEKTVGDLDRSCLSLISLPCEERYGLIFVLLDRSKEMNIDDFLGDFAPQLHMADLDSFTVREVRDLKHKVNWKLALCGYLESYHVKTVHASSGLADNFIGNLSTHDAYGPDKQHFSTTWPMNDILELAKQEDISSAISSYPYSPFNTVLYLWPNTIITAPDFIGIVHLIRITPGVSAGLQHTDFRVLHPKVMTDEERDHTEAFDKVTIEALEIEDYGQGEGIQNAMNSGIKTGTFMGANEPSLIEMHRSIARAMKRAIPDLSSNIDGAKP